MSNILLMKNGTKLYTDSNEMPSMAPLILAHFSMPLSKKRTAEFCSGNGVATFWMCDRGFSGETDLVDQRGGALLLAEETINQNGFSNVKTLQADIREFCGNNQYDLILCNPPFYCEKDTAKDEDRNAVRHENGLTPDALCKAAALSLKQRGHLRLCYTPLRLTDMLVAMRKYEIEPKKLRFCRHKSTKEPFLVLIDGIYKGGNGISIMPELLVTDENGNYTDEMSEICAGGSQ